MPRRPAFTPQARLSAGHERHSHTWEQQRQHPHFGATESLAQMGSSSDGLLRQQRPSRPSSAQGSPQSVHRPHPDHFFAQQPHAQHAHAPPASTSSSHSAPHPQGSPRQPHAQFRRDLRPQPAGSYPSAGGPAGHLPYHDDRGGGGSRSHPQRVPAQPTLIPAASYPPPNGSHHGYNPAHTAAEIYHDQLSNLDPPAPEAELHDPFGVLTGEGEFRLLGSTCQ